ncbi:hypothetical protein WME90_42690 [Sorangium sp. So ce375]|uniref:hypothetical protein n=1 Tax=Sorangium sp. So ce375 TaxID=3133306 RepID=UPI003F5B130B
MTAPGTVLGDPHVRPDAVLALMRFLDQCKAEPTEEEVCAWMLPATASTTSPDRIENPATRVRDVRHVAEHLDLIVKGRYKLVKEAPKDWDEFGDLLHKNFIERRQHDVIDTYASMVVEIELRGTGWLMGSVASIANKLADRVKQENQSQKGALFNPSRWAGFRAWAIAMGLGLPGPDKLAPFLPHPAARLARVVRTLDELAHGREMRADVFLESIGRRMPYLDHGERYDAAWFRVKDRPAREVSRVLSYTLLDLERNRHLELRYEGGDRPGARRLADGVRAFATVRLGEAAR